MFRAAWRRRQSSSRNCTSRVRCRPFSALQSPRMSPAVRRHPQAGWVRTSAHGAQAAAVPFNGRASVLHLRCVGPPLDILEGRRQLLESCLFALRKAECAVAASNPIPVKVPSGTHRCAARPKTFPLSSGSDSGTAGTKGECHSPPEPAKALLPSGPEYHRGRAKCKACRVRTSPLPPDTTSRQHTVTRHPQRMDPETRAHLDHALLPVLKRLAQGLGTILIT